MTGLPTKDGWMLVDGPPREFEPVLVFVPGSRVGNFQEEPDMIHVAFQKNGSFHLQDEDHFIVSPTHWMPLPAGPASK